MQLRPWSICLLLFSFFYATSLHARVTRVEVASRTAVLGGRSFGAAGPYERITGRVYFSLPVASPHNRAIVDLDKAVNLHDGEVEFSSDFIALRPADPARSNGTLILEVPNRGRSRLLALVDGGDWNAAGDAGDAWLLRNGFSFVSLGWQWDAEMPGSLRFYAPVAKDHGRTITGLLRGDLMPSAPTNEIPLGHLIIGSIGGVEYPVANPEDPRNTLTVRTSVDAPRRGIPRARWRFAHAVNGALVPNDRSIYLDDGFKPGLLYEYVYAVKDPVVAGGGFAAVRDFASYAKHQQDALVPAARVIAEGISQNGRFLRDLLYQGFNADEQGRIALDGILAHVGGAGRGSFNYRFAQPSRDAQPTSSAFYPTDIFPFTDQPETDPATGAREGLLDRAMAEHVVPRIFFSQTSYEYWGRAAALLHTTVDGRHDLAPGENVRIYHFTGLQHFSGPFPPARGKGDLLGQQPQSPLPIRYLWRAMIANMDAWVRHGTPPPPSAIPHVADKTLVPLRAYKFPPVPGVHLPHEASAAYPLNFGPGWRHGILALQPPRVGRPYPVLVPQVNADGNEMDGVHLPEITVPLATYAAWNLRDAAIGAPGQRVAFECSYLPFPKTRAEREQTHDPRPSIAERYSTLEDYLARYAAAVDALIAEHWILPEDRAAVIERGRQEWDDATH